MQFNNAKNQFVDNVKLFGRDPEKYNLYNGLGNLAHGLNNMENEIRQLSDDLHRIKIFLGNSKR